MICLVGYFVITCTLNELSLARASEVSERIRKNIFSHFLVPKLLFLFVGISDI